jgi:hypothetical protein
MYYLPVAALGVELLNGCPVREGLIAHRVDVAFREGATVGTPDRLRKLWQSLLPLGCQIEGFTLSEVCTFERAPDNVYVVFFLSDPEIYPIVHHFAQSLEFPLRDVELYDLRAGYVAGPVETLAFIPADYEDVVFVDDDDFALRDFAIVDLEGGPAKGLKIVECMLIQLCKVE